MQHPSQLRHRLIAVKLLHTAVWLLFVGCILAIPVASAQRNFPWAVGLTTVIVVECVVLACNHGRCPLTDWAARYTDERAANFDIYLPEWIARHNKMIFGSIFAADLLFLTWQFAF